MRQPLSTEMQRWASLIALWIAVCGLTPASAGPTTTPSGGPTTGAVGGSGGSSALLDGSNHTDTLAVTIARGDLVFANTTPKWDGLTVGDAGAVLVADGTDFAWDTTPLLTGNWLWGDNNEIGLGDIADATIKWDGTNLNIDLLSGHTNFTSAIKVDLEDLSYSNFGPVSTNASDAKDTLVAVVVRTSTGNNARRAGLFSAELNSNLDLDQAQTFGINAFVTTKEGFTVSADRVTIAGGLTGGRYAARHKAAGIILMAGGVASMAAITGPDETGEITDGYAYLDEGGDGGACTDTTPADGLCDDGGLFGGIVTYHGLWIKDGAGTITNKIGIHIEDLTIGTATDVGIQIDGADTHGLWFNNDSGTANDGITFRATDKVSLWGSAANTLETDGAFIAYKATNTSTGTTIDINEVTIATAPASYVLPDECDSATGAWATLIARDAELVSLAVTDSSDTINMAGLALSADEELDSSSAVYQSVTVVCMETNEWYVTASTGTWVEETP